MARRLYIVPQVPIGSGPRAATLVPKYIAALTKRWGAMQFGFEQWLIVVADLPDTTHDLLALEADVIAVPRRLDAEIGTNLTTVQTKLEMMNLPSGWITASQTYRFVLRMVVGAFRLASYVHGYVRAHNQPHETGRLFPAGVTLSTQYNQLNPYVRDGLIAAADHFKIDRSGLSGTSTLRQIVKTFGEQVTGSQICGIHL